MRLQDNLEVELKLSVIGDDPDALLDEVAALRQLGGMRLEPADDHQLRDVYWDLPDGGLRARHLSLRLRQIDDRTGLHGEGRDEQQRRPVPALRAGGAGDARELDRPPGGAGRAKVSSLATAL